MEWLWYNPGGQRDVPCLESLRKSYLKQSQQHSGKRIAQESMLYLTGMTTLIPSREEKEKTEG